MDKSEYLRGVAETLEFLHKLDDEDPGPVKVQEVLDDMRKANKLTRPEYKKLFTDLLGEKE